MAGQRHTALRLAASLLLLTVAAGGSAGAAPVRGTGPGTGPDPGAGADGADAPTGGFGALVPVPVSAEPGGSPYRITRGTRILVQDTPEVRGIGEYLAGLLRPSTGYRLPVTGTGLAVTGTGEKPGASQESQGEDLDDGPGDGLGDGPGEEGSGGIRLRLADGPWGEEGYRLTSGRSGVTVTALRPAGLFHGVQTLRQLLPAEVESREVRPGPWKVPGGVVEDRPRYAYRGAHLDVARHFFTVDQVKRYIDQLALYKINTLHLHLTDDQGWRLAIDSRPRLTAVGGATEVGGTPGGYYTKDQYREIVAYAASRHLEVVPEIDVPGHTNAALTSYPELNCDGVAPPPYTGIEVGFSSLCVGEEATYDFVEDVIREVAALTPGRYLHIGGDEAHSTPDEDYAAFMARVQPVVAAYGKTVIGWHQLTAAAPAPGALVQYWGYDDTDAAERDRVAEAARAGTGIILSPADRAYLDMKYTADTPLGLDWAGLVEVRRAYDWDPGTYLAASGVPESAVRGVEAPLWTETLTTSQELEFMAFPRLPGIAELGWSPASAHGWEGYRERLAAQAPRWDAMGVAYHRSPQVPWPSG
ncbi:family 20 glycosylhydrolase [Streptomyces sp. UH6]|uniref:family 20 glycosylhydrolase n=1 Tax=Streptomyces sp. UH6 TaxID=2748379 RepID=UPI0015D4C214|nr:family 20 glycosylhydrolase [Streptomyces sp. UH6]NYV75310.1 beta-N-acetylhexosaminidase [Streptomyces sp. UH6]